ncbi:DNA internalization-related competence protein ComEC/Rec2 [Halanaerobium hydrogeniformans]|uniref:DNA internalization-related competence protein ComEC/Rec2 n=1 Tax=Halanaerobium hydrogeniformans TaxID=656519 RepID=E4RIP4_HALHG|nr:DNA internalization-related competence protein ComEC/Rec2 [Halanaerobium hydrogeniformans]ADQ15114.1 DNA internalization-related competence protein ComEC/Rec2 [Halanaerobium hydrogeniformans]
MNINRKPFICIAFAMLTGIILARILIEIKFYFALKMLIFIQLISILYYFIYEYDFSKRKLIIVLSLVFLLFGSSLYSYQEYKYHSSYSIVNFLDDDYVNIKGRIIIDPADLEGNNLYIKADYINGEKVKYGKIITAKQNFDYYENNIVISADIKVSLPEEQKNPGGFCYRSHLKQNGIYLQSWSIKNINYHHRKFSYKNYLIKSKYNILSTIDSLVSNENAGFIKAILLGERSAISYHKEKQLQEAGASHLLAISGLHIAIIIMVFSYFAFNIFEERKTALCVITLFNIIYIILVGVRASILRASIFALLYLWAEIFNRKADFLNIIAFSLLINLLINPYLLFTVGLQLSYSLVLTLYYLTPLISEFLNKIFAVSIAAQLAAIPLTAYYFGQYAYIALITNLWAIPIISFLLPLILFILVLSTVLPPLIYFFGPPLEMILNIFFKTLELMTQIQGRMLTISRPNLALVFLYYIIMFTLPYVFKTRIIELNNKKFNWARKIFPVTFLIIFLLIFSTFNSGLLELHFISVGQGDGIYIQFPDGQNMLVDTGPPGPQGRNIEYSILPFLNYKGVSSIDYLVISHFHADHTGGIPTLLENKNVRNIFIAQPAERDQFKNYIINYTNNNKNSNLFYLSENNSFNVSGCRINFLNPPKNTVFEDENKNSLVFLLEYGKHSFIFTGDLYSCGEKRIVREHQLGKIDVLKVGHHGSDTSSSKFFLDSIAPDYAVIPVGRNNFNHPAEKVIKNLEKRKIKYFRTDKDGAVAVKTDGINLKVNSFLD